MAGYVRQRPVRIAVGQIADYTGKTEADGSGRKVTAGAALMAMSALNKAGVQMVERFDTSVAEMELKYANNKLIGDDQQPNPQAGDFRKIMAGSIPGSDYYIVGGITELNFNIRSENANGNGGGTGTNATTGTLGGSLYVMNIGMDLRLVNTSTLEVADVISYQKQIIGRQVSAGVFDFLGTNFFDVSVGESAGADPAGRALGPGTRRAGDDHLHLSHPGNRLRQSAGHRQRSAARRQPRICAAAGAWSCTPPLYVQQSYAQPPAYAPQAICARRRPQLTRRLRRPPMRRSPIRSSRPIRRRNMRRSPMRRRARFSASPIHACRPTLASNNPESGTASRGVL